MSRFFVLLFTLFFSSSAFAYQLRVCVAGAPACYGVTILNGAITVYGMRPGVSDERIAESNEKMKVRGLGDLIKFGYTTPEIEAIALKNGVETVYVSQAELEQELNLTEEEYDKLAACGVAGATCAGSILSLAAFKFSTIPFVILTCGATYYTCKDANRTLDKYIERIQNASKKLKEKHEKAARFVKIPTATGGTSSEEPITTESFRGSAEGFHPVIGTDSSSSTAPSPPPPLTPATEGGGTEPPDVEINVWIPPPKGPEPAPMTDTGEDGETPR